MATFLHALHANCVSTPSKPALYFYDSIPSLAYSSDGSIAASSVNVPEPNPTNRYSYLEILSAVHALVPVLKALKLASGSRVLLVYPPCPAFLIAFMACTQADLVPVPVFPPDPRSLKSTIVQFKSIVSSSGATTALTSSLYGYAKKVSDLAGMFGGEKWPDLKWIVTDSNTKKDKAAYAEVSKLPSPITPSSDVAFLQYTSGSTSMPKGVVITHRSLLHNLTSIAASLKTSPATVCCSWLPQYHDMGLIGSYLGLLHCGGTGHYLSPLTFITNPLSYLRLIHTTKATHMQCPNFAFRLCVKRYTAASKKNPDQKWLDLSATQHIINAAEPIDHATCYTFLDTFSKAANLPTNVLFPTYGLAEHTVFVCSGGNNTILYGVEDSGQILIKSEGKLTDVPVKDTQTFIACGDTEGVPGISVKIVNPETCIELEDDGVGEIWVASESKSRGYWGMDDTNAETFDAKVVSKGNGSIGDVGYLRTGDLGFIHKQELYVSGRLKDLIIVRGRNYYPQDIESAVEGVSDDLRPGCTGCFVISNSQDVTTGGGGTGEDVGVLVEVRDSGKTKGGSAEAMIDSIFQTVQSEHGLALRYVVLLEPRTVPKTTSGKIARSWCKRRFLSNDLKVVKMRDFGAQSSEGGAASPVQSPREVGAAGGGDGGDGGDNDGDGGDNENRPSSMSGAVDPATIRGMDETEIQEKLLSHVSQMSSIPPASISLTAPLTQLMDSMSVSQLKGLLEGRYAVSLSDEYMFREDTTLGKIVDIVKLGYAPDDSIPPPGSSTVAPEVAMAGVGVGGVVGRGQPPPAQGPALAPPGLCCTVS
jgi:acyl-CoA synthetase (AMP-forming)/AMP-acid ligase II